MSPWLIFNLLKFVVSKTVFQSEHIRNSSLEMRPWPDQYTENAFGALGYVKNIDCIKKKN